MDNHRITQANQQYMQCMCNKSTHLLCILTYAYTNTLCHIRTQYNIHVDIYGWICVCLSLCVTIHSFYIILLTTPRWVCDVVCVCVLVLDLLFAQHTPVSPHLTTRDSAHRQHGGSGTQTKHNSTKSTKDCGRCDVDRVPLKTHSTKLDNSTTITLAARFYTVKTNRLHLLQTVCETWREESGMTQCCRCY